MYGALESAPSGLGLSEIFFACFDCYLKMVIWWREGAGGVICECTGQIVRFVEVYEEWLAFFVGVGVIVAARGIGGVSVGLVHELDEETMVRELSGDQLVFSSVELKRDVAVDLFILNGAQNIGHLHDLHVFITGIRGRDAKLFFNGIPLPVGKDAALLPGIVP